MLGRDLPTTAFWPIAVIWAFLIEEGRAASKSPHEKFGYFISISHQAVSVDITKNSAVSIFKL